MSEAEIENVRRYVAEGGKIVATFDTSMYDEFGYRRDDMALKDVFGIREVVRKEVLKRDHIRVERDDRYMKDIDDSFIAAPHYCIYAVPETNAESHLRFREKMKSVYADIPPELPYPFIIKNRYGKGESIYIAGTVGQLYHDFQLIPCKRLARNVLDDLTWRDVTVESEVDSVNVELREKDGRWILHLINYTGGMARPIDGVVKLRDVSITIRRPVAAVKSLRLNRPLSVVREGDRATFVLPELRIYDVIVMEPAH
jgi:hypothetical protein